ncbi:MAG: ATP-binding protein [Armatimonas sp.]
MDTETTLDNTNGVQGRRVFDTIIPDIEADAARHGGAFVPASEAVSAAGWTLFDTPTSDDTLIQVVVPKDRLERLPNQASVRINSRDGRTYLGTVVRGPYTIPDGIRADAVPLVATAVRGGFFLPEHHGLVLVEIAGEERGGAVQPHRFRPLPNSPVYALTDEEISKFWGIGGDVRLGIAFGHEDLAISFPLSQKQVLPRHLAILGTTGGGKSTTVARSIAELQKSGASIILLDTEGEYTAINEPTDSEKMTTALKARGLAPEGVDDTHILYLVGRETTSFGHPDVRAFSPQFCNISPFAAEEIFDLNDAQKERFQKAITVAARLLEDLKIWNTNDIDYATAKLDIFDEGYPKMRMSHVYDVVRCIADMVQNKDKEISPVKLKSPEFEAHRTEFDRIVKDEGNKETSYPSWRKVQGQIGRIERLNLFDNKAAQRLDAAEMLQPGRVTIVDLSDSDSPLVNNLVIAELLRSVQAEQDLRYRAAADMDEDPTPVVVMIEEAHEFLSDKRLKQMPILHAQVERIAKRGRKRWLSLCFITQLPQHLPDEILGLVNNFILHKISDQGVVTRLRRMVGGVDDSLWQRLPRLAPGQAIVSLASLSRPVLTSIDAAPCRLHMVR